MNAHRSPCFALRAAVVALGISLMAWEGATVGRPGVGLVAACALIIGRVCMGAQVMEPLYIRIIVAAVREGEGTEFPDRLMMSRATFAELLFTDPHYRLRDVHTMYDSPKFHGTPIILDNFLPRETVIFMQRCDWCNAPLGDFAIAPPATFYRHTGKCTKCDGSSFVEYHRIESEE